MNKPLFSPATLSFGFSAFLSLVVSAEDRHTYVSKIQNSDTASTKNGLVVEFNEKWSYSPSKKLWTNANGEAMSADDLLRKGKISLRPAGTPSKKETVPSVHLVSTSDSSSRLVNKSVKTANASPFVYVWDETKSNKIRIMCTGFGTFHSGMQH